MTLQDEAPEGLGRKIEHCYCLRTGPTGPGRVPGAPLGVRTESPARSLGWVQQRCRERGILTASGDCMLFCL